MRSALLEQCVPKFFLWACVFLLTDSYASEKPLYEWHYLKGKSYLNMAEGYLNALSQQHANSQKVLDETNIELQLNQANKWIKEGDSTKAAVLLYGLLSEGNSRETMYYSEIIYRLAEILFEKGMFEAASFYYKDVIHTELSAYVDQSFMRLLQIAQKNENLKDVDEEYAWVLKKGYVSDSEKVAYAQALIHQNRGHEALSVLGEVSKDYSNHAKVLFLKGNAHLLNEHYDFAKKDFLSIVQLKKTGFYEQASLALARISYEEDALEDALVWYGKIGKKSQSYEDVLHELPWVYVRYAELSEQDSYKVEMWRLALRAAHIFVASSSRIEAVAEVLALSGHVHLLMQKYQDASSDFSLSQVKVGPLLESLSVPTEERFDALRYVDEFAGKYQGTEHYVVPYVRSYLEKMPTMRRAVRMVYDLREVDEELKTLKEYFVAIDKDLKNKNISNDVFYDQDMYVNFEKTEKFILSAEKEYLTAYTCLVESDFSQEHKKSLDVLLDERKGLDDALKTWSANKTHGLHAELKDRILYAYDECNALEQSLKDIEKHFILYQKYLDGDERNASLDEVYGIREFKKRTNASDKAWMKETLDVEKGIFDHIKKNLNDLFSEVEGYKKNILEEEIKERQQKNLDFLYRENIKKEFDLVSLYGKKERFLGHDFLISIQKDQNFIDELKEKINVLKKERQEYVLSQMNFFRKKTYAILSDVDQMSSGALGVYREGVDSVLYASKKSASFVYEQLKDIYIRGDVGVLDVVWKMKEDTASLLSKTTNARHRAIKSVESQYENGIFE
jgi:thioredoxin-like negative regulator of GroEL